MGAHTVSSIAVLWVIYYHNNWCVCAVAEQFLPGGWPSSRKDCTIIPEPFKHIFSEGVVLYSDFQVFVVVRRDEEYTVKHH